MLELRLGMHIVLTGNPVEGFKAIGPFATGEEAVAWSFKNFGHNQWREMSLISQDDWPDFTEER